jgi:predicted dehydrogenase
MNEKLRVGLVGLGWWGRTMLAALSDSPKVQIVAACDSDPSAAAAAPERGVPFVSGLDEILQRADVEAVLLCTPHSLHADQILRSAAARKHVFCEKPLCLTRADACAAIAACRQAEVTLGVGHERRFEPPILELRRLVAAGELGALLQIEANFSQNKFLSLPADNWRLSAKEAPAGPMTATGIHLLDLAVSFFGEVEFVSASVSRLGSNLVNGDTLGALVRFRSGAHALISAILATPFEGRFAIYGSKGWAEVRDKAHPEASEGWTLTLSDIHGRRSVRDYPPASAVRSNVEAFAAACRGEAPYPVSPEEMIATISAFEAIVRSAAEKSPIAAAGS